MTRIFATEDRTSSTDDLRIEDFDLLPSPESLIRFFPIQNSAAEAQIRQHRNNIRRILHGEDRRLLLVIGPCSIHDPAAALEYAQRLYEQRLRFQDQLEIVMRVYFEKPRTTVGWKGLINDPYLDGSFRINEGLRIARHLLIEINRMGLPAGSELLDTISPQYISDLISWSAIGARTTESQVHRELASGTSAPIGFKNGTDGNIKIALDAMLTAAHPHRFLGVHKSGRVAMVRTQGNPDCHLILRGGKTPNYFAADVEHGCEQLQRVGLPPRLMIDTSHANCNKQHLRQLDVAENIAKQIEQSGQRMIFGVMTESFLVEGAQSLGASSSLQYGQSVTDPCLGWEDSVKLMERLAQAVSRSK